MSENNGKKPLSEKQRQSREISNRNLRPFQPGRSGNPNGRPLSAVTLISKQKELYALEAPQEMLKGIEQFIPAEWKAKGRRPTWLEAQVIRNSAKAISLKYGDYMAKTIWEQLCGKPTIQISGPDGGPIGITNQAINLKKLTDEQLEQLTTLLGIASEDGTED